MNCRKIGPTLAAAFAFAALAAGTGIAPAAAQQAAAQRAKVVVQASDKAEGRLGVPAPLTARAT